MACESSASYNLDENTENHHRCYECGKQFSVSSSLYRHVRNIHKHETDPAYPKRSVICPLCKKGGLKSLSDLQDHAEDKHAMSFKSEKHVFKSKEEFESWKLKTESETCSQYVKKCGTKRKQKCVLSVYYCNRSGMYVPEGSGIRALKTQGSNRIQANCPARLQVTYDESNEIYEVVYFATHLGHQNQLAHITLSVKDKEWVASELLKGITMENLLKKVRDSLDGSLQRVHLIERKDIANIGHC